MLVALYVSIIQIGLHCGDIVTKYQAVMLNNDITNVRLGCDVENTEIISQETLKKF